MTGDAPRRPTAPGPAVPDRRAADRAAWATFAIFVLNGLVFARRVSRLPAVRDALGLSPARLGVLLLVGSLGSVIALPLTGAVVQRLGTARTVVAAAVLNVTAFAVVAVAVGTGQVALLAPALFLAQIGIAAWDVAMNLQGTVVEQALGRAIMPRFHAGFSSARSSARAWAPSPRTAESRSPRTCSPCWR